MQEFVYAADDLRQVAVRGCAPTASVSFAQNKAAGPPHAGLPSEKMPWTLQYAAAHGDTALVSMLLKLGRDANETSLEGNRPLDVACLKGDAATTRLLLESGANPNLRNKIGATPLRDAASFGRLAAVKVLLQHGADLSAQTRSGQTALQLAINNQHDETAGFLRTFVKAK